MPHQIWRLISQIFYKFLNNINSLFRWKSTLLLYYECYYSYKLYIGKLLFSGNANLNHGLFSYGFLCGLFSATFWFKATLGLIWCIIKLFKWKIVVTAQHILKLDQILSDLQFQGITISLFSKALFLCCIMTDWALVHIEYCKM